jgi:hypothetical protein
MLVPARRRYAAAEKIFFTYNAAVLLAVDSLKAVSLKCMGMVVPGAAIT